MTIGKVGAIEVDFVATRRDERLYVQVAATIATIAASSETRRREYASLEAIADNFPKYVLTLETLAGDRAGGIHHVRIAVFVLADND